MYMYHTITILKCTHPPSLVVYRPMITTTMSYHTNMYPSSPSLAYWPIDYHYYAITIPTPPPWCTYWPQRLRVETAAMNWVRIERASSVWHTT